MNYINEIKPYKSRFKIKLNNGMEILLYKSDIKKYHLSENEEIPENRWQEIVEDLYKRAKERVLYLLDSSYKTEKQIVDKLKAGYYPQEVIDRVIDYLKEYNLVNDYRYALMYIDFKRTSKSKRQIIQDLYVKGISKDLIEPAFEESGFSDRDSIVHMIEKRKNRYDLSDKKDLQKFYMYLTSKGYSYGEIRDALNDFGEFEE